MMRDRRGKEREERSLMYNSTVQWVGRGRWYVSREKREEERKLERGKIGGQNREGREWEAGNGEWDEGIQP